MFNRRFAGMSANGHVVSVNLESPDSHAATHYESYGEGFHEVVREALGKVAILGADQSEQVEMGRKVGLMDLIPTAPAFYYQRKNRDPNRWYPGIILPRGIPTTTMVIITHEMPWEKALADDQLPDPKLHDLKLKGYDHYDLFSAFPGLKTPGLPDGPEEYYVPGESDEFWRNHALRVAPDKLQDTTIYMEDGVPAIPQAYRR